MTVGGIYVYLSEHGSRQIAVLRISPETGALERIQDVPVTGKVMPMAVSPDRRFLFAALRSEPYAIASFAIDAINGTLTHLAYTPAPESAVYLCTDATGRFLLGACNPPDRVRRTGSIFVSAISPHGCVQVAHQVIRTPPKTHAILPDPTNRFVFASSCDADLMVRYAFDALTGTLDPDALPPVLVLPKSGPRHFLFHPNNRFMYLMNEYDASVCTYRYDARNGSLQEIQISSALPPGFVDKGRGGRGADLHFTPDGKWLYASVRDSLTLAVFRVDAMTGLLNNEGHFPTLNEPRGFNIDPFGRYLLAAGLHSSSLACYKIDAQTGALGKPVDYATGQGPNWVEIVRLP
jgi:6-phosphogluconolactonase